jgi:hypothetical protein|tara:strand:- start:421 stop:702 length:282 start_codon:yes stop_codon:yes gene_type:complete
MDNKKLTKKGGQMAEKKIAKEVFEVANNIHTLSTQKPYQSIDQFQVDTRKQYSAIDITNAVEKVLEANGYCETDSYEMNSFLMDVLEKVGHYK